MNRGTDPTRPTDVTLGPVALLASVLARYPGLLAVGVVAVALGGVLLLVSVGSGVAAMAHLFGVRQWGRLATVVGSAHLAWLVGIGLYAAYDFAQRRPETVFSGLRTLVEAEERLP